MCEVCGVQAFEGLGFGVDSSGAGKHPMAGLHWPPAGDFLKLCSWFLCVVPDLVNRRASAIPTLEQRP